MGARARCRPMMRLIMVQRGQGRRFRDALGVIEVFDATGHRSGRTILPGGAPASLWVF